MEALAAHKASSSILTHIQDLATIAEQCVPISGDGRAAKYGTFERAEIAGWTAYNKAIMSSGHLNSGHLLKLDSVLGGEVAALRQAQAGEYCLSCDVYYCIIVS